MLKFPNFLNAQKDEIKVPLTTFTLIKNSKGQTNVRSSRTKNFIITLTSVSIALVETE
jgi:hypothetical protein